MGQDSADTRKLSDEEVVEKYRDFVEGIAGNLIKKLKIRVEHEDLVAYGFIGLLQAWERYDPSSKAAFTSFAYYRVQGAMYDGCRKEGWASRRRDTNIGDYAAVNDHLESHHEANASAPQARSLSESVDRASDMVGDVLTILFVRSSDLENVLVEPEPRQDVTVQRKAENARLNEAIKQLGTEERVIIKRHHYYDESMHSIAADLNRSVSWVSRKHAGAIAQLRDLLAPPPPD